MITANKRTGKKPARRNDFWFRHWQKHLVCRVLQPPDFFPVISLYFFYNMAVGRFFVLAHVIY